MTPHPGVCYEVVAFVFVYEASNERTQHVHDFVSINLAVKEFKQTGMLNLCCSEANEYIEGQNTSLLILYIYIYHMVQFEDT
jgi:hypothetical protein